MRHRKSFNHLGRTSGHRKAMLANMACSLILHKRIETTVAKAKALRVYVEPLISKSKEDTTHSRRTVFGYIKAKEAVAALFRDVAPKIADRPGGYTRILKTRFRLGDGSDMAIIELVDFNEAALIALPKKEEKKGTRRSRTKKSDQPKSDSVPKVVPKIKEKRTPKIAQEAASVGTAASVSAEVTPEVVLDVASETDNAS